MAVGSHRYSPGEELANRLTHGLGAVLSVAGLVLLVVYASLHGTVWHITSTAIYGVTLVLLYCSSTLYHSATSDRWKKLFQKLDHAAIFLLIAGTYTPFLLGPLRGPWGWSLFGVVWGVALAGSVLKFWHAGRFDVLSTVLYILLGWLMVIAAKPLMAAVPAGGLWLLFAGGFCYTFGTIFYLWRKIPFNHAWWHLWVLGGSGCHWAAIYVYVVPHAGA